MQAHAPPHHASHLRTYLIIGTLLVGGIFILLLMNNNDAGFSLNSAVVGDTTLSDTSEDIVGNLFSDDSKFEYDTTAYESENYDGDKIARNFKEVEFDLHFDEIPTISKNVKVDEMVLRFDDLTTKIRVNDDYLELTNLKEVSLSIEGFDGDLDIDSSSVSIDGFATKIAVNDIALSTKTELRISFENLDYQDLSIQKIQLREITLEKGSGSLSVEERLEYTLEGDAITINEYEGLLDVSRVDGNDLDLNGISKSMQIRGDLVSFNVG